jgi:hypothetical protein
MTSDRVRVTLDLQPGPHEVAVAFVPAGTAVSLAGEPLAAPASESGSYVMVPGAEMGWEVRAFWCDHLSGVRNGHHRRDRDVWHAAARRLARTARGQAAVIYVAHEPRPWYRKTVLQAVTWSERLAPLVSPEEDAAMAGQGKADG